MTNNPFTLKVAGIGWIELHMRFGEKEAVFSHSYDYGDGLQSFLERLVMLAEESGASIPHRAKEWLEGAVEWFDDIYFTDFFFSWEANEKLRMKVVQSQEGIDRKKDYHQVVGEALFDWSVFLEQVLESLEAILEEYGLIGYKNHWQLSNFPVAEYLTLKAAVEGRVSLENGASPHEWPVTKIKEELRLLQNSFTTKK